MSRPPSDAPHPIGLRAYRHAFPGEPRPHLWCVLSEPDEPPLAICLSVTSSNQAGERLLVIPKDQILTGPGGTLKPFRTTNACTVFIARTLALTRAEATSVFTPQNCHGLLQSHWLWKLRAAVRDGADAILDPPSRTAVAEACALWFP